MRALVREKRRGLEGLRASVRYVRAVAWRFRTTGLMAILIFAALPLLYTALYRTPAGAPITFGAALHHVYFLLFGQPSLEYVDDWFIEVLNVLIPPVGLVTVVDGGVRFAYLFFAKHRADKEWVELVSESMRGHVVVCGAGRVGYRVVEQLIRVGRQVMVIEKDDQGHFVGMLRDAGVPVLIDNVQNPKTLERVNIQHAEAIVCATNDDLTNLNVALDARKANPHVRVVLRLFDEDLVERVRDNFRAEAHSTSALSAPAIALSALDPRIAHSFDVGGHLMVVSAFTVGPALEGMKVSELRDRFGGLTLAARGLTGPEELHPRGERPAARGEVLTLQLRWDDYLALRRHTGEAHSPLTRKEEAAPPPAGALV